MTAANTPPKPYRRRDSGGTMTTETLTLTDFLLARIAEDEAWWCGEGGEFARECQECAALSDFQPGPGVDRLLAECEMKRRIVAELVARRGLGLERDLDRYVQRCLALPYADHPDYRDEWKP